MMGQKRIEEDDVETLYVRRYARSEERWEVQGLNNSKPMSTVGLYWNGVKGIADHV